MQKSRHGIYVWFWSRDDPTVPPAVRFGLDMIFPGVGWVFPSAAFPLASCDYNSHFNAHKMVFDLTFCVGISCFFFDSSLG